MDLPNCLALLALLLGCCLNTSNCQFRIIGGSAARTESIPYIAALLRNGQYFCAGGIVSMRHVITAAHCIANLKPAQIVVKAGASNLRQGGQTRQAVRFYYSGAFSFRAKNEDIGMIILKTALIAGPEVATRPLCSTTITQNMQMRVSGWGKTSERSSGSSNQLRTAIVSFVNRGRCRRAYGRTGHVLTNSMMCAGRGSRDACAGDSGAPGIVNGQICGVVSYGLGCARNGFPGVYTALNNRSVRRKVNYWLTL